MNTITIAYGSKFISTHNFDTRYTVIGEQDRGGLLVCVQCLMNDGDWKITNNRARFTAQVISELVESGKWEVVA